MLKSLFQLSFIVFLSLMPISQVNASKTVTMAAMEWPPFYGQNLPENGVVAAITREAFLRTGYQLEINFMPWKRALGGAQSGIFDGVLGLYFTEERERTLAFTDAIYQSQQVFIKRTTSKKKPQTNHPLIVAVQLGTHQAKVAQEQGFTIYPTNTNMSSMILLAKDRVDLALMSLEHFRYIQHAETVETINWDEMQVITPPFQYFRIYNAFGRKLPHSVEIAEAFNKALLAMQQDGSYEQILSRFGFSVIPQYH